MIVRTKVLWLGHAPSEQCELEHLNRGLQLDARTTAPNDTELQTELNISRALVISYDDRRKGSTHGWIRDLSCPALDFGLKVILIGSELEIESMRAHLPQSAQGSVTWLTEPGEYVAAELASKHEPGPATNFQLEIRGHDPGESSTQLIRRAFSDYSSVSLKRLAGGKSSAEVFLVHAEHRDADVAGSFPLPHVAKIDVKAKIATEKAAFRRYAEHYVPFSNRPNIQHDRCLDSSTHGIIVGNFVDGAVPLSRAIRPFGSRQIIHSLFDDALACWRHQAFSGQEQVQSSAFWSRVVNLDQVKAIHVVEANRYGIIAEPSVLKALLEGSTFKYKAGPIHGDLNAENVFSRNHEAVLIDFYKADMGPLSADLACLETALAFTEEAKDATGQWIPGSPYRESSEFIEWKRQIDSLFTLVPRRFGLVGFPAELPCSHSWIWSASRQLRLMAHYLDEDERGYAFMLGLYILRLAMYDDDDREGSPDRAMRGVAYFVGQAIVTQACTGERN